jgi:hypothetical protein
LNIIGNPPALPGDSKSLTFAGVLRVFKFTQYWTLVARGKKIFQI